MATEGEAAAMGPVGEAFCPSEQLTTRIRNILGDYPAGVASFKEMLQNADDARAREFQVLYDATIHGTERLLSASLAPLQRAPAVLVFNDAEFSERDFQNILSLGDSAKRTDVGTVGKYGLGFNVVYHLTDVVSFVSGERLVVFDPHGRHLPGGAVGRRYTLEEVHRAAPDTLAPFAAAAQALGVGGGGGLAALRGGGGRFPGTLFRLPLRDADAAANSLLCKEALGEGPTGAQRAREMLSEFAAQAPGMLLFLQHVEALRIFEATPSASGDGAGARLLGSAVVAPSPELPDARANVARRRGDLVEVQARAAAALATTGSSEEDLEEATRLAAQEHGPVHLRVAFPLSIRCEPGGSEQTWAVAAGFEPRLAGQAAELGQLAYVSVAVPLFTGGAQHTGVAEGRLYCGLPLPISTGLPFHANAPFALSSNRRDIWIASRLGDADREGAVGRLARWNEGLLHEAVPRLLVDLLLALRPGVGSTGQLADGAGSRFAGSVPAVVDADAFYGLLPRPSLAAGSFEDVARAVLRCALAANAPLFADVLQASHPGADQQADVTFWRGASDITFLLPSLEKRLCKSATLRDALRHLRAPSRPDGLRCVAIPPDLTTAVLSVATVFQSSAREHCHTGSCSEVDDEGPPPQPQARQHGPQVLSRRLLRSAVQALAPPAPAALSVAAAEVFSLADADELLCWLLEPVDQSEARYDEADDGRELHRLLDGVPLVPLSDAPGAAAGAAGGQKAAVGSLGVLRLKGKGADKASLQTEGTDESLLFLNPHPHIPAERMLQHFPRLVDPACQCAAALREIAAAWELNLRLLSPAALAAGLVAFVVPRSWLGCRVLPPGARGPEDANGGDSESDHEGVEANDGKDAGAQDASGKRRAHQQKGAGRGGKGERGAAAQQGAAGKKDKVKVRQMARREMRSLKEAGDAFRASTAESSHSAGAAAPAVGAAAAGGRERGVAVAAAATIAEAVQRLALFWRFLEEFQSFHDFDGLLDPWPLLAADEGPQLLTRRQATAMRLLRARDMEDQELVLLRSFGALTLHAALRPRPRAVGWGCAPRREALAAVSLAQGGRGGALPPPVRTREECLELRRWVRRFVAQDRLTNEAADGVAEDVDEEEEELADAASLEVALPLHRLLPLLPIFETVAGGALVALGVSPGASRYIGAPAEAGPFAPSSPWETVLAGIAEWRERLLSYADPEARWALKAAGAARSSNDTFLPLLRAEVVNALPQSGCLLYLSAVAQVKPWRHVGSAHHMRVVDVCSNAKLLVWEPGDEPQHPRCRAAECADADDAALKRVMEALADVTASPGATDADEQLPFPPRAYRDDADVLTALRQAGLRNLSVPETFQSVAEMVAKSGNVQAGDGLTQFILQQPDWLVKHWPAVVWINLRKVPFVPCYDCTGDEGLPPPPPEGGECQRLAQQWAHQSNRGVGVPALQRKGARAARSAGWQGALKTSTVAGALAELEGAEEEDEGQEEEQNVLESRKDEAAVDLLVRAAKLMYKNPLGTAEGGRKLTLVAPSAQPTEYLERWHCWSASPFLPSAWARAVEVRRLLFRETGPGPAVDRLLQHLRKLGQRTERTAPELRQAWKGPLLWALCALRESRDLLPSNFQPVIVLDNGEVCRARDLCLDVAKDLGFGPTRIRAVPGYLRGLASLLGRLGASSASFGVPQVQVSANNPFQSPEAAMALLASAVNDPTFADVVFHFEGPKPAVSEAYAHRLVLGRASEVFQNMVSGPLAVAAERADGRLHITLPAFVDPGPFSVVLGHIYTGATEAATAAAGVYLQPPNFEAAQFVCSVLQLADHFFLPFLKQWCEAYLAQPELLTVESVVGILTHADACNASQLFHVCVHQIGLMHEAVILTSEWAAIPDALQQRITATLRRGSRTPGAATWG